MNRPYISMVIAAGFLIILGYFYFDLEKGTSGISVLPDDEPVKIGFSLLDEKFGFGSDAPAVIVLDADINSKPIGDAINIWDLPEADPQKIKNQLLEHELIAEDLSGDTLMV